MLFLFGVECVVPSQSHEADGVFCAHGLSSARFLAGFLLRHAASPGVGVPRQADLVSQNAQLLAGLDLSAPALAPTPTPPLSALAPPPQQLLQPASGMQVTPPPPPPPSPLLPQ